MAVTFIPAGRLGNYFFTCAAVLSYSIEHGLEFSAPNKTSSDFWSPLYMPHLQGSYNPDKPSIKIRERQFHYMPIPFSEEWREKNIILSGYFQSEKYFLSHKEEVLSAFNLDWHLVPDVCSIQARFSDYLTIPGKHIVMDEPYLRQAMSIITDKTGITKFKVFSDDIPHFKRNLGHIYNFEYSENADIWSDFIDISCCHSHINSSSTFSWWSAYVNKNPEKVIITNSKWFQDGWRDEHGVVDTKDILPESWIKI
jgi:hypothetical protein